METKRIIASNDYLDLVIDDLKEDITAFEMKSKPITCQNLETLTKFLKLYKEAWENLSIDKLNILFGKEKLEKMGI